MAPIRKIFRKSTALQSEDPNNYFNATLSGNFISARAHTALIAGDGDTLIANGNNSTLFGGAGKDSLVALGNNNALIAGTGVNALVGSSLRGAFSTLVGNGRSSLTGGSSKRNGNPLPVSGANTTFILNTQGDTISAVAGSTNTILTGINNYSLDDALANGKGVRNVQHLIYTGVGGSTLRGNALNGSLVGSTTAANSLVSGTAIYQGTLRSNAKRGSSTLRMQSTDALSVGQQISGRGIPQGTAIISIVGCEVTLSRALTSSLPGGASITAIGSSTLIGGRSADTLVGNGRSFLVGGAGDDVYVINTLGDKIIESGGVDTVLTKLTNFSLADSVTYGAGILNVENLTFDGTLASGAVVTLAGNALNNTIVGVANASNYLSTGNGPVADSLVGGLLSDTLIGNRNSTLNGGDGANVYYVYSQGDVILDTGKGSKVIGVSSGSAPFIYDLNAVGSAFGVDWLQYTGAALATLSGNANPHTIIGGLGRNSLMAGSGAASLVGGSQTDTLNDNEARSTMSGGLGNDLYIVSNSLGVIEELSGSNGGNDTISTSLGSFDLSSEKIASRVGIENLIYTGDGESGTFAGNQLSNLIDARSAGDQTLIGNGGVDTLLGSTLGSNLFQILGVGDMGGGSSIVGSQFANDTLQILTPGAISDSLFGYGGSSFIQSVEVLTLTGGANSITLGGSAGGSEISTVYGGNGGNTMTQGEDFTGSLMLIGGSGSDSFNIATQFQLSVNSIDGGDGVDTLALVAPVADLADDQFSDLSGIEVLSLAGNANSVTFGSIAQDTAGLRTVIGGNGGNAFTQDADFTNPLTLVGGTGSDRFNLDNQTQLTGDSIVGGDGSGTDTLAVSVRVAGFEDTAFSRLRGIEVLSLAGVSNSVTLGSVAQNTTGLRTLIGGGGNDTFDASDYTASITLDGGAGNNTLLGGNQSDLIITDQLSGSSIAGGAGTDTLQVVGEVTDFSDFSRITSVEVFTLGSELNSLTLGSKAQTLTGVRSVIGGSAADTIDASTYTTGITLDGGSGDNSLLGGTAADSIVSGAGNDTISGGGGADVISSGDGDDHVSVQGLSLGQATIDGGSGIDTLAILGGVTSGRTFSNISGFEALLLTDTLNFVNLGSSSGIMTVLGGAGNDTLNAFASGVAVTLDGGSGNNSLLGGIASDSIVSGAGNDTILAGSGNDTIFGGGGGDSIVAEGGNDLILLTDTDALTSAATLDGGDGIDTLAILEQVTDIKDDIFGKVSRIEVLDLSASGSTNSVTLGSKAQTLTGVRSVIGGSAADTIDASAYTTGITIDGRAGDNSLSGGSSDDSILSGADNDTIKAGSGNDTIFGGGGGDSIVAEGGNDLILLTDTDALTSAAKLDGGAGIGEIDTLAILGGVTDLKDDAFTNVTGIEVLSLVGNENSVTLGSRAAGITTIVGGNSNDRIAFETQAHFQADSVIGGLGTDTLAILDTVNINNTFGNVTGVEVLSLGDNANSVTLGSSAVGITTIVGGISNDRIAFETQAHFQADSVIGGLGTDTLAILGAATLNDAFSKVSGVEVLSLAGNANSVTLGTKSDDAGILTVVVGNQSDRIAYDTEDRFRNDTIIGGLGIDTLAILGGAIFADDAFTNITGIEVLDLSSSNSANSISLGTIAKDVAGIRTVVGGSRNDYIEYDTQVHFQANTIIGGAGTDTLALIDTTPITLNDSLTNLFGVEVLDLSGSGSDNSVTLGTNAQNAGIITVIGGAGNDTLDASSYSSTVTLDGGEGDNLLLGGSSADSILSGSGNDTILAGSGNDTISGGGGGDSIVAGSGRDLVRVDTVDQLTLDGGTGTDILAILETVNINNAFTNITGIEVLSLGDNANSVTLGSNALGITTIVGGISNDRIAFGTQAQFQRNSVIGGLGVDTLAILGRASLNDSFSNVTGIEVLDLSASGSSNAVMLSTNAARAGIQTVVGDAFNDTFNASSYGVAVTLDGGSGNNSLWGGTASDSIVSGADNDTILAGSGNDTIYGGGGRDSIIAGEGDDLLRFDDASWLSAAATLDGTSGKDSIQITDTLGTIFDDTLFANVSRIGAVVIDGGNNSITLDSRSKATGITSLFGGDGNDTFDGSATAYLRTSLYLNGGDGQNSLIGNTGADTIISGNRDDVIDGKGGVDSIIAGAGNDIVSFSGVTSLIRAATLDGGTGTDTLALTDISAQILADSSFSRISGIEVLALGDGANSVTLSVNAARTGLQAVFGGAGNDTLSASAYGRSITLDGGTGNNSLLGGSGNDSIVAGNGIDRIDAGSGNDTIFGGGGADFILAGIGKDLLLFDNVAALQIATTVDGGTGTDTISFSQNAQTINDTLFSRVARVECIVTADGDNSVILQNNAFNARIQSVIGGSGDDTFNASNAAYTYFSVYLDGGDGNDSLIGNAFSDTFVAGDGNDAIEGKGGVDSIDGGAGDDLIRFATADDLSAAVSVNGGLDIDTLALTAASQKLADADFARVSGIEVLQMANGSNAVTLGAAAYNSGIESVFGGINNDTFDRSSVNFGRLLTLAGGIGNDSYYVGNSNDIVVETLNSGIDWIYTSLNSYTLPDNVENLIGLNGSKTLVGNNLANSIVGNDGGQTINGNGGADTIIAGDGNDLILFDTSNFLNQVGTLGSLDGGIGRDTLGIISDKQNINDAAFKNISRIEVLQTANGANSVALQGNASLTGIQSVIGGSGADSFTASSVSRPLFLDGGDGNDSLSVNSNNNTLIGGVGNDTITANGDSNYILSGDGNDLIRFDATTSLGNVVTLNGGNGFDTVAFTSINQSIGDTLFANVGDIEVIRTANGSNSVVLQGNAASTGIRSIIGGSGDDTFDASDDSYATRSVYFDGGLGNDSLLGNSDADTFLGGAGDDTLQAWSGSAALNTASDTLTGGTGVDWFILGDAGDNAYGNGGAANVATITDFAAGAGGDKLQLCSFGGAESAGYQTLSGGAGIIDIYTTSSTNPADHVAQLTVVTGAFNWADNVKFV